MDNTIRCIFCLEEAENISDYYAHKYIQIVRRCPYWYWTLWALLDDYAGPDGFFCKEEVAGIPLRSVYNTSSQDTQDLKFWDIT